MDHVDRHGSTGQAPHRNDPATHVGHVSEWDAWRGEKARVFEVHPAQRWKRFQSADQEFGEAPLSCWQQQFRHQALPWLGSAAVNFGQQHVDSAATEFGHRQQQGRNRPLPERTGGVRTGHHR